MRTRPNRTVPKMVRLALVAGVTSVPLLAATAGAAEPDSELAPSAAGYDLGLAAVVQSYTPTAVLGEGSVVIRVNVCNQSTDGTPSGTAAFTMVVGGGAGYPGPPAVGTVRPAPEGNIIDVPVPDLVAQACQTFDVPVQFDGQTSPFVVVAEISSASGTDVDSTPSPTPTLGVSTENDRTDLAEALSFEGTLGGVEDDRDIAVQVLQVAQATTTSTAPTTTSTAPTTTSSTTTSTTLPSSTTLLASTTVVTTAPGPGIAVSPAGTLPITGSVDGTARNPLMLLGVALPLSWFGAVLALRARRLSR